MSRVLHVYNSYLYVVGVAACLLSVSCAVHDEDNSLGLVPGPETNVIFTDVTALAGHNFEHHNGR